MDLGRQVCGLLESIFLKKLGGSFPLVVTFRNREQDRRWTSFMTHTTRIKTPIGRVLPRCVSKIVLVEGLLTCCCCWPRHPRRWLSWTPPWSGGSPRSPSRHPPHPTRRASPTLTSFESPSGLGWRPGKGITTKCQFQ